MVIKKQHPLRQRMIPNTSQLVDVPARDPRRWDGPWATVQAWKSGISKTVVALGLCNGKYPHDNRDLRGVLAREAGLKHR